MVLNSSVSDILKNFGGINRNNLNELLQNPEDLDNAISIVSESPYIDPNNVTDYLKSFTEHFSVLGINIQCLNAKFDKLKSLIDELAINNVVFSAICLQETWIEGDNPDVSLFELDNYTSIPLKATCSSHGGLLIYLHKNFQYNTRDFYSSTTNWEGQFIDIFGDELKQKITLCNIYRPPRDRNDDIQLFINDLAPVLETLSHERSDKLILGDFNLDLLKINTREKYSEFLDLVLNNGFVPKITLPTRFSERRATLIDNIFCNLSHSKKTCISGIVFTNLSDHLPYFTFLDQKLDLHGPPKFIKVQTKDEFSVQNFIQELSNTDIMGKLNPDLNHNPNSNYDILEDIICSAKVKHLPIKTVKFNKHKHKRSPWMTNGVLRSINFRDNLYKKLKCTNQDTLEYLNLKQNLKAYNKILDKNIRELKQNFYQGQFTAYKGDTKKTWDVIRSILNLKKNKRDFPLFFKVNNTKIDRKSVV